MGSAFNTALAIAVTLYVMIWAAYGALELFTTIISPTR